MTRDEAIKKLKVFAPMVVDDTREAIDMAIETLQAEPVKHEALSADAVSEDMQTEERARLVAKETELAHIEARIENAEKRLQELPKHTNCTEFIEWLTAVVLNDKDWGLNAVAYGEIICRKLVKLGVLEVTEEPSYYIRPSALQAEPKRGTWTITHKDDGEGGEIQHLICSECKSEPMAWSSKRFFNYCPNCGAKMDKD